MSASPIVDLNNPTLTQDVLRRGAEQVISRLRRLTESVGPSARASLFYSRYRVKEEASIFDKIARQQRFGYLGPDPHFSFRDITDYAGMRLVCLQNDDLKHLVNYILELVDGASHLQQPIFSPENPWVENFEEAYFLPQDVEDKNDIYEVCHEYFESKLKRRCESSGLSSNQIQEVMDKCATQRRTDGYKRQIPYSSAHIRFNARSYDGDKIILVPLEIQIRTVADDIWAEINHDMVYKFKSSTLWARKAAMEKEILDYHNAELKAYLHDLHNKINEVSASSENVNDHLRNAWKTLEKSRDKSYHYSNCLSLYFAIDDEIAKFGSNTNITNYVKRFYDLFGRNSTFFTCAAEAKLAIDDLVEIRGFDARAEHEALVERDALLKKYHREIQNRKEASAISRTLARVKANCSLYQQRQKIINLEILRVQIFVLRQIASRSNKLAKGDPATLNEEQALSAAQKGAITRNLKHVLNANDDYKLKSISDRAAIARQLYINLCRALDDRDFAVRPLAMGFYWKYLSAVLFDRNMAIENLRNAHRELVRGELSLPRWSIYHSAIPRSLAQILLVDAETRLLIFDPDQIATESMVRFKTKMRQELINTILHANEALIFDRQRNPEKSRDLHLGFSKGERLFDAAIIMRSAFLYEQYFAEPIDKNGEFLREPVMSAERVIRSHFRKENVDQIERNGFVIDMNTLETVNKGLRNRRSE